MKRIKDKRKRKRVLSNRSGKEVIATHIKLVQIFPDIKKRLHYIKSIIKDLNNPNDPVLVEGRFPEME